MYSEVVSYILPVVGPAVAFLSLSWQMQQEGQAFVSRTFFWVCDLVRFGALLLPIALILRFWQWRNILQMRLGNMLCGWPCCSIKRSRRSPPQLATGFTVAILALTRLSSWYAVTSELLHSHGGKPPKALVR